MKPFATLWAGISTRMKLRFTTTGIKAVAEEVVGLPSVERIALFVAVDATDAPDELMRRAALIRAYINNRLGGIPEERALEAELEASLGLCGETKQQDAAEEASNASPLHPTPTSPIPGPVAPFVHGKSTAEKTPENRAREAHENALAEANAHTPARKPERIVPRSVVVEKRNSVPFEANQRLHDAHERGIERTAADAERVKPRADNEAARKKTEEECARRRQEVARARAEWENELYKQFTTRALIKARQKEISTRHVAIKSELADLEASVMDAAKKSECRAILKAERDKLGMEFEIISSFWSGLFDDCEEGQPTFTVTDSARKAPAVRNTGKTARTRAKRNGGGATDNTKPPSELTSEELDRRRQEAEHAASAAKADRKARAEAAATRRNDPHFGESRKGSQPKKGKSANGGDSKKDRLAVKQAVKYARG